MTTFDDRDKRFEKEFALQKELVFKVTNRKHKLLGLWAAAALGKSGADAEAYAREVVLADFEHAGDADVIAKLLKDFAAAGKALTEQDIRAQMPACEAEARRQIMGEEEISS